LVFYAVQQSDDFILLTALRPAGTHLPGPTDASNTLTEISCRQLHTKSCNKLPTRKCDLLLIYQYIYMLLPHTCLSIVFPSGHCQRIYMLIYSPLFKRLNYSTYKNDWYKTQKFNIFQCASLYRERNKDSRTDL
jgi:hypothetical protein